MAKEPGGQESRTKGLYEEVGGRIREARMAKDVTQEGLAKRVGLTRTSITNVEAGRQKLLLHTLVEIAEALGVDVRELLPSSAGDAGVGRDGEEELSALPELAEMTPAERRWILATKRVLGRGGAGAGGAGAARGSG